MTNWMRDRRCRGEDGAALILALVFMVLVGVLVFYVLGYAQTSVSSSNRLDDERRALYAVDSATNGAIRYVQNSSTLGIAGDTQCGFASTGASSVNGKDVTVECAPDSSSGQTLGTSSAPGFAVLTMAPFTNDWDTTYTGGNSYPGCSTISTAPNAELGIVQTQDSRQVRITGDVKVNSDVDADLWSNSCPQIYVAQAIQVAGGVTIRESCHDIFATAGNQWLCGNDGQTDQQTQQDAGRTPNAAAPNGAIADPEIANPTSWAPNFTSPPQPMNPTLPTCGSNPVLSFSPGTYTNAAALSALTNGTNPACAGKLFWFAPGNYYFLFPTGNSQWTIDEANARIVGGTPNAVPTGTHPVGPITVVATNPPAPTTGQGTGNSTNPAGFSNPTNAVVLGETPTPLLAATGNFNTSNQIRWLTTGGYKIAPPIGDGASSLQVHARVQHRESWTGSPQIASRQLLIRNSTDSTTVTGTGGVACVIDVPGSATSGALTDSVNLVVPDGCLDAGDLNDATYTIRYQVQHSNCGGGNPCQNVNAELDGIQLTVDYIQSDRPAWDPSDPSTVTPTSPKVPGACVHDGDYGFGPNSGVQWVFGGESHVRLNRGNLELCNSFSDTHQEIVLYGVKTPPAVTAPLTTLEAPVANITTGGFTNPGNARQVNAGGSATASLSSNTARTLTFTNFPSLPGNATITGVTVRVRHQESSQTQNRFLRITQGGGNGNCADITIQRRSSLTTDQFTLTSGLPANCLDSVAKLNGVSLFYSIQRSDSSTRSAEVEGIDIQVTYTTPGQGNGLTPQTGCITHAPYYNVTTHAPGNNGTACAVVAVAPNSQVGSNAPRTVVFWGTVYAPAAAIDVPVNVLTVPVFNRGVVARMLMLGYNIEGDAQVPMSTTPITANVPQNRRMTFTATTPGNTAKVVADVEFCDIATAGCPVLHGSKIWSWKVTR